MGAPITANVAGRPYATTANVSAGKILEADGDFSCIEKGAFLTVGEDDFGLFVPCAEGPHYLDGQLADGGVYIGLHLVEEVAGPPIDIDDANDEADRAMLLADAAPQMLRALKACVDALALCDVPPGHPADSKHNAISLGRAVIAKAEGLQ